MSNSDIHRYIYIYLSLSMSFIKDYSRSFQGYIIIMFNYTEVKNFCTLLYIYIYIYIYRVAIKIVPPSVEKILLLLQLRNESDCRFPTQRLLKLVTVSVLVLNFRPKSNVVQVLLKKYVEFFTLQNCTTICMYLYKYGDEKD